MTKSAATILAPALAAFLGIAGTAGTAQAQQENYRVELNFSNPGARSLGLGGAFVALADDATAAYANPAGLINLSRPEVSVEGRRWKYTQIYPTRGHAFGPLGLTGAPIGVDDTKGVFDGESSDTTTGASFLSYVYPMKRCSLALYRHELANFEANVETQGLFFNAFDTTNGPEALFRFRPIRAHAKLDIVNYGISGAYRINDRLSAGLGVSYYDFALDVSTRRYGLDSGKGTAPGGFFGPPDYSDANLVSTRLQEGDGNDVGFSLGFLWKVTDTWSLGTVYRQSVAFDTTFTFVPGGLQPETETFQVPEVFTFGTAFRPTEQVTVSIDLDHINYSDTFDQEANVRIDDADEVHFGLEYVLLRLKAPVSLRAGAWYDPDHQASYRGVPDETNVERAQALRFPRGQDAWHYAGGLGFVLGDHFQVDGAFDLSDRLDTLSLSTVYRF